MASPHPEGVAAWHLASSLALRAEHRPLAKQMLKNALKAFENQGEIFTTIRMAVEAEMLALGLEGKLPGKESEWKDAVEKYLTVTYPDYAEKVVHNPFTAFMPVTPEKEKICLLYRMADTVAY